MVLIMLEYTYEGIKRSFCYDVNNDDQYESMRRKFVWAARSGVEIRIIPTSLSVKHPVQAA